MRHIPLRDVEGAFWGLESPRLLNSFGKRLGYLYDHEGAQEIVAGWFREGGLLYDLGDLNSSGAKLVCDVASVDPGRVLDRFECQEDEFFSWENPNSSAFAELLGKIAYDAELFEKSVDCLARFCVFGIGELGYCEEDSVESFLPVPFRH